MIVRFTSVASTVVFRNASQSGRKGAMSVGDRARVAWGARGGRRARNGARVAAR